MTTQLKPKFIYNTKLENIGKFDESIVSTLDNVMIIGWASGWGDVGAGYYVQNHELLTAEEIELAEELCDKLSNYYNTVEDWSNKENKEQKLIVENSKLLNLKSI